METMELDWRAAIKVLRSRRAKLANKKIRGGKGVRVRELDYTYAANLAALKSELNLIEKCFKTLERREDAYEVIEGKVFARNERIQNKMAGRNRLGGNR
jgi:hypothetical protein